LFEARRAAAIVEQELGRLDRNVASARVLVDAAALA
jgi:hypothetical protein